MKKKNITHYLALLGIPAHLKGYKYIHEAIYLMCEKSFTMQEVYTLISSDYQVTNSSIEKAIRDAIRVSFKRGDYQLIEELFGYSIDQNKDKPTNAHFINTITNKINNVLN